MNYGIALYNQVILETVVIFITNRSYYFEVAGTTGPHFRAATNSLTSKALSCTLCPHLSSSLVSVELSNFLTCSSDRKSFCKMITVEIILPT